MAALRPTIGPVEIIGIHSSGKGITQWNDKKYYIPHTIPEEIVIAETQNSRRGFRTAVIQSIIKPSEYRIKAACPFYDKCGGCHFQHIRYAHQLRLKQSIIQSAFNKYGIHYPVPDVTGATENFYYRNKVTFEISYSQDTAVIGFHPEWENNSVIAIDECIIVQKNIHTFFQMLKPFMMAYIKEENISLIRRFTIRCNQKEEIMLVFELALLPTKKFFSFISQINKATAYSVAMYYFISKTNRNSIIDYIHIEKTPAYLYETIENKTLRISPATFFQNNMEITEKILRYIEEKIDFEKVSVMYDLYSGNGTLSMVLCQNKETRIIGIEGNVVAVSDAIYNATINKDCNSQYICGDVLETFTESFLVKHPKPDVIMLDPPRSGTLIEIQKNILRIKPTFIVYVSCNPVSLAWNLSQLLQEYDLMNVQPFDMFPQTYQVETVVLLCRKH